jgi:hypothetical protein
MALNRSVHFLGVGRFFHDHIFQVSGIDILNHEPSYVMSHSHVFPHSDWVHGRLHDVVSIRMKNPTKIRKIIIMNYRKIGDM